MKRALSVSLLLGLVVAFSAACDNGKPFGVPNDAKVIIWIGREINTKVNPSLRFFANDFNVNRDDKGDALLMFTCPCYLAIGMRGNAYEGLAPVADVYGQQILSLRMLPDAAYNISERRLESGEERSYYFPRK